MDNGILTISLDFELAWGFHDGNKAKGLYKSAILGARTVIPKILDLFDKYSVHATWATVGALRCESKSELLRLINKDLVYLDGNYKIYEYIKKNVGENEEDDPLHYAGSLLDLIQECPHQYIGSHTFSHFFLLEKTMSVDDFEQELRGIKALFPNAVTNVFARNQITDKALSILNSYGFIGYRGIQENNSILKIYKERRKNPKVIRALRLIDTYIPLTGYYDYSRYDLKKGDLFNIRSSSFLRPFNPSLSYLEPLKLYRIKKGMKHAAQTRRLYHLYWHPHNFGINQEENLKMLEELLQYYAELKSLYKMESLSMEEVCTRLKS